MPHVYQPRACVGQSPNNKRALSLKNVLVLDAFGSAGLNWEAETREGSGFQDAHSLKDGDQQTPS